MDIQIDKEIKGCGTINVHVMCVCAGVEGGGFLEGSNITVIHCI